MVLSDKFLNVAEQAVQNRLDSKLLEELEQAFPEQFTAEAGRQMLVAGRKECAVQGIVTAQGIFTRLAAGALLGDSFFEQPGWQEYQDASAGISDYATGAFFSALSGMFGIAVEERNGWALHERAAALLPSLAAAAAQIIRQQDSLMQLVALETSRQSFLSTSPGAVIQNPYDARIAGLYKEIRKLEDTERKLKAPAQEIAGRMTELELKKIGQDEAAGAANDSQEWNGQQAALEQEYEEQMARLQQEMIAEQQKTGAQLAQLMVKNRGLRHEAETLRYKKPQAQGRKN